MRESGRSFWNQRPDVIRRPERSTFSPTKLGATSHTASANESSAAPVFHFQAVFMRYFSASAGSPAGPATVLRAILIRTLLAIDAGRGSLTFAGDVPQGTAVQLMHANYEQLIEGAGNAARDCLDDLGSDHARFGLLISCVGRKLMMGNNTDLEVDAVVHRLGGNVTTAGFYSYGEIGPFGSGGMCDLHNQTMTVTVFDTCAA